MWARPYFAAFDPETGEEKPYEFDGGDIQAEDVTLEPVAALTPSGGGNKDFVKYEKDYFTDIKVEGGNSV